MSNYPDYENYEALGSFTGPQLQAYRQMLLEKTKPQVEFIRKHVPPLDDLGLCVLEIGSGNGRLLISLAEQGILGVGAGYDISRSRTEFASVWSANLGYVDRVYFAQRDVLKLAEAVRNTKNEVGRQWDLAVCITGCFQYFYPISPSAPHEVLDYMRSRARYSLFELYKRPQMGRTWKKLSENDPWRYILDEYEDVGDWVRHTKTFIGGEADDDTRVEHLAYYTLPIFIKHLQNAGYKTVHWAREDSQSMVVLVS